MRRCQHTARWRKPVPRRLRRRCDHGSRAARGDTPREMQSFWDQILLRFLAHKSRFSFSPNCAHRRCHFSRLHYLLCLLHLPSIVSQSTSGIRTCTQSRHLLRLNSKAMIQQRERVLPCNKRRLFVINPSTGGHHIFFVIF